MNIFFNVRFFVHAYQYDNSETKKRGEIMKKINEIIKKRTERSYKGNNFDFGYEELGRILSNVNEDGVITLFGYPAMGKTTFMLNLISNLFNRNDVSVLYITTDGREDFIIDTLLSVESMVPIRNIIKERINETEVEQYNNALNKVKKCDLYLEEHLNLSSNSMIEITKSLKEFFSLKSGKKIVVFDQYSNNPEVVEMIRKYTVEYNAMLFILAPALITSNKFKNNELDLADLDPYLNVISDCVISIFKPSYFNTRMIDNSVYFNILKCPKIIEGEVEFSFDFHTLKYYEEQLIYDLPSEFEMDSLNFDKLPF